MRNIRYGLVVLTMLACMATVTRAEVGVNIDIGLPQVNIGINLPYYPEFHPVPGYPVYYAPRTYANYFFYDGMYWVYQDDNWYASYWFNGPWWYVEPDFVPLFILRVPVFYYWQPPPYFRGWHLRRPPRWGEHWGREWERRRSGWDRWDHHTVPPPAPLPTYQREYSGDRYPSRERQHELHNRHYRYQPRDQAVREHILPRLERKRPAPAPRERHEEPAMKGQRPPEPRYSKPPESGGPGVPPRRDIEKRQRPTPDQAVPQQRRQVLRDRRYPAEEPRRDQEQLSPRKQDQEQRSRDRERRQDFDRNRERRQDSDREREQRDKRRED